MMEDSEEVYNLRRRLVRKRKFVDPVDQNTSGDKESLEILDLPDLTFKKIFSFLSVRDLKKVRLVSTRINEAVLKNDKRCRTWKFELCRSLPDITDKVVQYNAKIEVDVSNMRFCNEEEIICWLTKNSSCITGIRANCTNLPQRVLDSLSGLKQVKNVELNCRDENAVKTLLSSLAPQLEKLIVKKDTGLDKIEGSIINLSSLKHLRLQDDCLNKETTTSIFKIVPASIEYLDLRVYDDIKLPPSMKQLEKLKTLKIYIILPYLESRPHLPTRLFCNSLLRLDLSHTDLRNLELVETDLPSLKVLELSWCTIDMKLFKNLLMKSSQSLYELHLLCTDILDYEDLDFGLPVLTRLTLNSMSDISWFPQLLVACSSSLSTLKLYGLRSCSLRGLEYDLPALKVLSLKNVYFDINHLLGKCSSSLNILHLERVNVQFKVNVPNLKELHLDRTKVSDFTKLVSPESSCLEAIGLKNEKGPTWNVVMKRRFPHLKVVYMIDMHGKREELETNIVTPDVKIITNTGFGAWYRHLKDLYDI